MGLEKYKTFIGDDKPAPDTVNPSLWRNAQLNMHYGLYKVTDRIYHVRGYDLKQYSLVVENGVLNYANKFVDTPDATLTLTTLDTIQLKQITVDQAFASNALVVEGKQEALTEFLGLLDTYPFWFNIVTP